MANMALGSRPKNEYERKLVGIVRIITGKDTAKLTLQEEGKLFKNGSVDLKVKIADLPKRPRITPEDRIGKDYRIRMNQEGDEVEAITPVRGHFKAKLVDLGPRPEKDSDPMPFEKTFTKGETENSHLEFFAVYEITEGAFKGVQLPAYWMHYKFEEDTENEGFTRFAGNFENKKATRLFQVRDWGLAHGLWNEDLPWDDDTILPTLLDRALDNDVEVEITLDKGYIILVQASENYEEPDDIEEVQAKVHSAGKRNTPEPVLDDVDEDFPVKKVSTNGSKKPSKLVKANKVKQSHEEEEDEL